MVFKQFIFDLVFFLQTYLFPHSRSPVPSHAASSQGDRHSYVHWWHGWHFYFAGCCIAYGVCFLFCSCGFYICHYLFQCNLVSRCCFYGFDFYGNLFCIYAVEYRNWGFAGAFTATSVISDAGIPAVATDMVVISVIRIHLLFFMGTSSLLCSIFYLHLIQKVASQKLSHC